MFLAVIAFFYIARPNFLIVKCYDDNQDVVEELNMWLVFIAALFVSIISTIIFGCYWKK